MKICNNCGIQVPDDSQFCPNCGQAVTSAPISVKEDKPSVGLNILAFFIPLVGLILYLVQKNDTPVRAKKIGKWALIGFILGIVLSIIAGVVGGLAFIKGITDGGSVFDDDDDIISDVIDDDDDVSGTATRSFTLDEGDGIVETMTFTAKDDVVIALEDITVIDTTDYSEEDIASVIDTLDETFGDYASYDCCTYSNKQVGNTIICTIIFKDLDDSENVSVLYEIGFVEEECDFISLSDTATALTSAGWVEENA